MPITFQFASHYIIIMVGKGLWSLCPPTHPEPPILANVNTKQEEKILNEPAAMYWLMTLYSK